MRILITSSNPITKDGITSIITSIVSSIGGGDIVFDLLCPNVPDKKYCDIFSAQGGTVYRVERSVMHPIRYIRQMTGVIKSNRYDILHSHGNSASLLMEMLSGIFGGVRVRLAHSHNTTCRSVWTHRLLSPLFRLSYTDALACGEQAGRWMFGSRPFRVIHNGIDVEKYRYSEKNRSAIREQYGIPGDAFVVGHVGSFNESKNHSFLLDAFSALSRELPTARLLLVGDGKLRADIERRAAENGLAQRVVFTGAVDNVSQCLSAVDLIMMPSLFEGLPLTLIEEQANGLRCLASDTITREVNITGLVSFLPISEGVGAWVKAAVSLAKRGIADRAADSADAGRKIADAGYRFADSAKELERIYHERFTQSQGLR